MQLEDFQEKFISNLKQSLTHIERHPHVENTLQFAAEFAISCLQQQSDNEEESEEMHPFLQHIFDFLLASLDTVLVVMKSSLYVSIIHIDIDDNFYKHD